MRIVDIDHVLLAMPRGEEDKARAFYGTVLGLPELLKPPVLHKLGGAWFGDANVTIHLGIEDAFRPARKAHPAFRVDGGLDELRRKLDSAGYQTADGDQIEGSRRFFADDPFGNRIEFLELT